MNNKNIHNTLLGISSLLLALALLLFSGCGNIGDPFGEVTDSSYLVEHINPANEATGVSVSTLITIAFPVDMDIRTLQPGNIVLQRQGASSEAVTIAYDASNRIATIKPSTTLSQNSRYELVTYGIKSASGISFPDSLIFANLLFPC